jgi:hypothetical protein
MAGLAAEKRRPRLGGLEPGESYRGVFADEFTGRAGSAAGRTGGTSRYTRPSSDRGSPQDSVIDHNSGAES